MCDAIPGTLHVVSEENATINEKNRFTKRFDFEWLLICLSVNCLRLSIGNAGVTGRVTLFLNHWNVATFRKIRV